MPTPAARTLTATPRAVPLDRHPAPPADLTGTLCVQVAGPAHRIGVIALVTRCGVTGADGGAAVRLRVGAPALLARNAQGALTFGAAVPEVQMPLALFTNAFAPLSKEMVLAFEQAIVIPGAKARTTALLAAYAGAGLTPA